jgi:NAD(P)-dependent dehydrogenase (short-subunit alcohol dehydrogenase family)
MEISGGIVEGKVALVTGAAGGIGRASALAFAREGARVAVADINEAGGAETVELIRENGGEARFFRCDISAEDDVRALIEGTVEAFGGLDCAHNNAGGGGGQAALAETTRENWDRTVGLNLTGTWLCLAHEIRYIAEHGGGAIVATSSASSVLGFPLTSAYAATKAGINQLVRSAAVEYAAAGIRINALLPGPIMTAMTRRAMAKNPDLEDHLKRVVPIGRIGRPADVAEATVWLCSDRASFITGVSLPVDGGQTLL